jgi:hypothetical protein
MQNNLYDAIVMTFYYMLPNRKLVTLKKFCDKKQIDYFIAEK